MNCFRTTNMARFRWKRLKHGLIVLHSLKSTLEYYKAFPGDEWQRWDVGMRMRATARMVVSLQIVKNEAGRGPHPGKYKCPVIEFEKAAEKLQGKSPSGPAGARISGKSASVSAKLSNRYCTANARRTCAGAHATFN
jgi:hypothetical protein